ncbi:unnamed protein product [Symbiodinium sp. CCMP2592]|nr:unnamed protein product [Symbiodinium sp. CCMP2592]
MASDHDAFANWLKTLAPEELAKLKAAHSASAQAAADTAVQDDARPCDSSSSLSPRSFLVYQNQEAFYHAQDGITGPSLLNLPMENWKPPAQQTFLPDAAKADPPTKAIPNLFRSRVHGFRPQAVLLRNERPPQPFGLAVIWDSRTWINFYGGEPPKTAVEIDVETHFYTVEPGSAFEPGQEEDSESSGAQEDLPPCPPLPEWYSADTGVLRYWHFGATGQANPRQMGKQSVPALCLQDLKALPEPLVDKRKNIIIDLYKPPALALPRLPCPNMRNCIIVPSLTLPHTFDLDPAFARMYYMGSSRGEMRCGLPCSTVPFCPYHSACGREITEGTVEHRA